MKLISTTDFVIQKEKEYQFRDDCEFAYEVRKYANFLKRPLELGMFISCDENGHFLQEPEHYDLWRKHGSFTQYGEHLTSVCEPFFKAKEKVLFEGFEVIEISKKTKILSDKNKKFHIWINEENKIDEIHDFKTIEDLILFDLELTPNAIKNLGL